MSEEDWVKAALTDDSVVVDLLVRLHRSTPPSSKTNAHLAVPLEWTVRQRRSKPILHHATTTKKNKKKKPTERDSPTTPLSWSGGATSASGGSSSAAAYADGIEESSLLAATRSKVTGANETTTSKRAKKKKTLAELKEEEILLVKEKRHLKRELATLRATVEKQRATNESLKRLKLNLEPQPIVERVITVASTETIPDQTQQKVAFCDPMPLILPPDIRINDKQLPPTPKFSSQLQPNQDNKFAVPDLNLPLDDDVNS